jgi:hypothetical protein
MTPNALLTWLLTLGILFSNGKKRSENPSLYFRNFRQELRGVCLKEDRLFKENLLANNWKALNYAHESFLDELNQAIDQLNKIADFKGDDLVKTAYLNGFNELHELYNADYVKLMQLKKYINRSDTDAVKYYSLLSNCTNRSLQIHSTISKAEKHFINKHKLIRIDAELFVKQHQQYAKLSSQLKHISTFFERIDMNMNALFDSIETFRKRKGEPVINLMAKVKKLRTISDEATSLLRTPESTDFMRNYYKRFIKQFQSRLIPLIEIIKTDERASSSWQNAFKDVSYLRLDYLNTRAAFLKEKADWLNKQKKGLVEI